MGNELNMLLAYTHKHIFLYIQLQVLTPTLYKLTYQKEIHRKKIGSKKKKKKNHHITPSIDMCVHTYI